MKYFTLEEAEALIPEIEAVFKRAKEIAKRVEAKAAKVRELEESGGKVSELELEKSQLQFLFNEVNAQLQEIADWGALPKGLDPALVDFPHRLGGREVYLCWKMGEKKITHYHGVEEGFAGRRKLPRDY